MLKLQAFLEDALQVSKGSMKIPTKGIIEGYRERYEQLIQRPGIRFHSDFYTTSPGGRVLVHIKVPSETVDNFHYDVLLELAADKSAVGFPDCDIKVFSNCPSFVYSVAYVLAHWNPDGTQNEKAEGSGMLVDSLKGKLPRKRMLIPGTEKKLGDAPIRQPPVVRNPLGLPLFDKSLYYAIFYMMNTLNFSEVLYNRHYVTMSRVVAAVTDFDSLMTQRKRLEIRQREKARREKDNEKKAFRSTERSVDRRNANGGLMQALKPKTMSSASTKTSAVRNLTGGKSPKHVG